MEERPLYPSEILKQRYYPVRDIPEMYGIKESEVQDLVRANKVKYAYFKDPKGSRRILHTDMLDVLLALGWKRPRIKHLRVSEETDK